MFKHKSDKLFIRSPKAYLGTPRTLHILYVSVWSGPGSYFSIISVWPSPNNEMQMLKFFCYAQMCLWWTYKAYLSVSSFFIKQKYATPTNVWATPALWAIKNRCEFISIVQQDFLATADLERTFFYLNNQNTAAIHEIRLHVAEKRARLIQMRHFSASDFIR